MINDYKIITDKVKRFKRYVVCGLLSMFLYAVFNGVSITMLTPLMDYVFNNRDREVLYSSISQIIEQMGEVIGNLFSNLTFSNLNKEYFSTVGVSFKEILLKSDPTSLLYVILGFVLLSIVLKNLFLIGDKYFFAVVKHRTIKDIRNQMFDSYLNQSLAFYNTNQAGDSLVRLVSDVNILSTILISSVVSLLRNLITVIIFVGIAFAINPKLFFYSLIIVPIFVGFVNYLGKKLKKYARRIQQQASTLFSKVEEVLSSMKIVKAFARESLEREKMNTINEKYMKDSIRSNVYNSLNSPISEILSMGIGIFVIFVGSKMILSGDTDFTFGSFTAFMGAIFSILHPLKMVTKSYTEIKRANVSLERVSVVVNSVTGIDESPNAQAITEFNNKISLNNVSFSYNKDKQVLKNVTFDILKGESVGVVGASGGGKSTLVNLINRMYDCTSGEVTIDGKNVKNLKIIDLRKLFGIVTQDSILFSETIDYNIGYGAIDGYSREDVVKAAKIAYADGFINEFPHAYDEKLQTKGSNLSGGQRQRLCIARAVVGNPPILIFDEATSALDTDSENNVQLAIQKATENRTVIQIAHRLSTILHCDKIIVMDDGKLVGMGKHEELMQKCPRYKELYDLQFNK